MKFYRSIGICVAGLFIACSTTVKITSTPPGARVFINEKYEGEAPLEVTKSDSVLNHYQLRLTKEGYRPINVELEKEIKAGAFIGGIFLWIPLIWAYGPEAEQKYLLEPEMDNKVKSTK